MTVQARTPRPYISYRTKHPAHDLGWGARRLFDLVVSGEMLGTCRHKTCKRLVEAGLAKWTRAGAFTADGYWQAKYIVLTPAAHARYRDYHAALRAVNGQKGTSTTIGTGP